MKKINLIEWLWKTDSHEKRSPQRFVRYAAMLLLLLTCVAHAWATNFTNSEVLFIYTDERNSDGGAGAWKDDACVKMWFNNSGSGGSTASTTWLFDNDGHKMFYTVVPSSGTLNQVQLQRFDKSKCSEWWGGSSQLAHTSGKNTFYNYDYANNFGWKGNYTMYLRSSTDSWASNLATFTFSSGTTFTASYTFTAAATSYQFRMYDSYGVWHGSNVTVSDLVVGATYRFTGTIDLSSGIGSLAMSKTQTTFEVTASSADDDMGSVSPASAFVGSSAVTFTATPETGYHWTSWGSTGGASPSNAATSSVTATADGTITANFAANTTTVTLNANAPDGETVTGGGTTVTATYDSSLPSFSALSCTGGYNLTGYWTADDGGTKVINANGTFAANSGIWNRTDGATLDLYAQWDKTNTLTVSAGSGVSSVTGSQDPVTLNTKYAISATPNTGYSFSGWTAVPSANAVFDDATAASTNVTVKNGSVTVTGAATENMTTVTVNVSPAGAGTLTKGGSAFTPGNTVSVGVTTGYSMVATPNSGYVFHDWTKTGNAAGTPSTNTFPLKGNGSAGTGTLTANFGIASGWYIYGDSWDTWTYGSATKQLTYPYRGMSGVYYIPTTIAANKYFRITDKSSEYNFSSSTGADFAFTKGTIYTLANNGSKATYSTSNLGAVWVVVNTNGTKKAWVQSSQTFHNVNVTNEGGGSKGTYKVTLKTTSAFTKGDNVFETTQYANGETFTVTVTGKTGWIPTITIGGVSTTFWKEAATYSADGTMSTSDIDVTISYTASYAVTFATTTGGNTITATGPNSTITTGTKVKSGTSITFTQTKTHNGYDFSSWNSASTGDGSDLGGDKDGLTKSITAETSVYPIYTVHTFTGGTLDKKEGSLDGSYSVTYLATTMTPSAPTRTGYNVSGYYKETGRSTLIADASGNLQKSAGSYTDASNRWTYTSSIPTLYTGWTAKTYTADDNLDKNGGDSHGKYTATYDATSIAINTTPAKTGYHVEGYYDDDEYSNKVATDAGALQASTSYTDASNKWNHDANDAKLYTKWTANTWYVKFNANGGSGSMDNESFTYDADAKALTSNAFTKTGYHFNGWNTEAGGGGTSYTDGQSVSNLTSTKDGIVDLYAQWAANTYSVVFNANGGSGSMSSEAMTYDAAKTLTTNTFTRDGYHFDGWAEASDGDVVYTDGQSVSNLTSTSGGTVTLYAHWTKSVLTNITFAPTTAAGEVRITATPVITPTPTGTTQVCWTMWSNSACTEEVDTATFTPTGVNNAVTFWTPELSGTYYIRAEYKTGSSCGSGTELNTIVRTYVVASEHTVTIKYMYDGMEIASRTQEVIPAADSIEITAPDLDGYTFSSWSLGDVILQAGEDPKPALSTSTIEIKALYDGVVTANYTKKDMIYFNNTLGWENVYVYFYSSNKYWDGTKGTGFQYDYYFKYKDGEEEKSTAPAYQKFWGPMERIEGTNIWRFDYQAAAKEIYPGGWSEINGYVNVAFTKDPQGYGYGEYDKGYDFFYETEVVRRGDFDHGMSMFVPIKELSDTKNESKYYNNGYWMNYPESSGYTLLVYYTSDKEKDKTPIRTVPFEFNEDTKLPSAVTVDLEAGRDYYFEVKTHHVTPLYYGNNGSMTTSNKSNWKFETGKNRCGMRTTAAGGYTFNWSYFYSESAYDYRMTVDYPATAGDYRIKYTDTEHTGAGTSYARYSRVINARESGVDTVSFFIATDKTPTFAIEYITSINASTGAITWGAVDGKSVTTTSVDGSKVYNIRIEQNADKTIKSATVIGAYEGNYYIRTDCASSKWNNYQYDPGNLMTYSEYAKNKAGSDYTHYFMAHANAGTNVKFVVANDYSAYLTDTLYQSSYRDGDASHVTSSGSLNAEANIRFMWDMRDNKVIRAYLAAAKEDGSEFLVLQGTEDNILDENGNALSHDASKGSAGYNHQAPDNAIQFVDKENWMYETTVQVVPSSYVKLYAKYNKATFYYYGSAGDFDDSHAIQLITGDGDTPQKVKVVYDFKTDRLVAAWQPPVSDIATSTPINADVMLVRSHQDAGQNIRFTESGALTAVKTVYGVMQFNRWILNNRDGEDDVDPDHCKSAALIAEYHPLLPANEMKSDYERFNYFISFPFDVKVGDIFGFGTYGRHWVLKYYDGKGRATNGYWADSESNWKYITNTDSVLHAYQGYLLKLSVSRMAYDNEEVWTNNSSIMELYFPSNGAIGSITQKNETIPALSDDYRCKINRGDGTDGDRRVKDSYWRCIGVPSFADYSATLSDGSSTIEWTTGSTLPYLYEWIMETNHLQAQATDKYSFEAMKAYLVQHSGQIIFSKVSAQNSIVARRRDASEITNAEWKLTLLQDEKFVDQAYIRLSDNENVTANFDFDQDLSKELNTGSNLYTLIGYEKAAANCLPLTGQTTIVPIGVIIANDGDYTFAVPEGTEGTGVTLVDNETGIRTSLSALDYTINLSAGTYNDRFVLEISPIQQMPTGVELLNGANGANGVRKVLIDGLLYIVKDGKMFDARGAVVK